MGGFGVEGAVILGVTVTAVQKAVINGWSRRQERQADLVAVRTVGADAVIRALEKLTPAVMRQDGIDWSPLSTHYAWQRRRAQIMALADSHER